MRTGKPSSVVDELAYWAKLNKPSPDIPTSEWDRIVEMVARAMKQPKPKVAGSDYAGDPSMRAHG